MTASMALSKKESAEIVEKVLETIKSELEQGELPRKIKISGFGNFVVREKGERTGATQTNDAITIRLGGYSSSPARF